MRLFITPLLLMTKDWKLPVKLQNGIKWNVRQQLKRVLKAWTQFSGVKSELSSM